MPRERCNILLLFYWKSLAWTDAIKVWNFCVTHLATVLLKRLTLSLLTFITHTPFIYGAGLLKGHLPQWKKQHAALQTFLEWFHTDRVSIEHHCFWSKATKRVCLAHTDILEFGNEIQAEKPNTSWRAGWMKSARNFILTKIHSFTFNESVFESLNLSSH